MRKPAGAFHHGNLRQAAIDAAVREVRAHGHTGLSLKALADKLGVAGPALYRHFENRRALLHEVAQVGYEVFEARLSEAADAHADAWGALLAMAHAYVEIAMAYPHWFRLQFLSAPEERPRPDIERAPPRYRDKIGRLLAQELGDKALAQDVYLGSWAAVHGLAVLVIEGNFDARGERAHRELVERALRGLFAGIRALAATAPAKKNL